MDPDSNDDSDGGADLGVDLTGFMFGNIDSEGKLENDIFSTTEKRHLTSLTQFGLGSLIRDFLPPGKEIDEEADSDSDNADRSFDSKADDAVDYSDITELAEEPVPPPNAPVTLDEPEDIESILPAVKLIVDTSSSDNNTENDTKNDQDLMPPPLNVLPKLIYYTPSSKAKEDGVDPAPKLDTPLAAIRPSKYANVDVRELFPDFRTDKVLHFSRLFGPGKPSSLPQIWRSVKNRRKKRKSTTEIKTDAQSDSTSDTEESKPFKGWEFNFGPDPPRDMCVSDDEEKFLRDGPEEAENLNNDLDEKKPKVADWRYGPAQVWYDLLNVSESGEGFNYGFKLKEEKPEIIREEPMEEIKGEPIPDDAFLMVSQLHWEDEVVWDGNEIKHSILQKLGAKGNASAWLPSGCTRAAGGLNQPGKGSSTPAPAPITKTITTASGKIIKSIIKEAPKPEDKTGEWYSIFPVENEELVYSKWEDDIIWDPEAMNKIPKPKVLTLDPNDENIILGIPDDFDPSKHNRDMGPQPKVKIPHPHVKQSKILLGKAGVINVLAEDAPPPPPKSPDRDPYNISNDVFYMAKSTESTLRMKVGGNNLIQHSTPVIELRAPFIPTFMNATKLRTFHRPPLRKYSHGALAAPISYPVLPLLKHIRKKAKQRELERMASGGGDVFFMRTPDDLTGRDGDLVLLEFCEEHPPFMNQVGMCSKIKNYYKRKAAKDSGAPNYTYGETAYAHTSPFLGILAPGASIQAVENAMYRAPIYNHNVPSTDFVVIRTRNNYFIREANALFTVGQECPLYDVFGPNSKRSNNFVREFLQVFIYRLFWKSTENPRKIRMDHIRNAFPSHSESSIRKRLKQCADFKRTGMNSNWWVIKPEFRLPTEEELRSMVSPEQCCAYYSMIAALQRLKDAGYGEKFIFAPQDDDDEEQQLKMDDEIKVAPWNTTRAYIQAVRGKCLLQLTGPADPTGCGEGFSYVRMPNKPMQSKEEQDNQPKRSVTGTDADLRRLSLSNAKALLRKYQVPEEEIKKLSRWEVIDVVRTLSTEKAKAGEEGMDKFSRGNRFSIAEHQERYKEECQRIFDLQNKVLASSEVLSTDEGESTASEESDLEEMGKNLENMLANKKTSIQLSLEREEQERQELLKKIMDEAQDGSGKTKKKDDDQNSTLGQATAGRVLKITRTFKHPDGRMYSRTEIVRRQPVIDAYVKIRTTKDETFIKSFASIDEAQKEEMKKERRRIQEQLRRIKRNQQRGNGDRLFTSSGRENSSSRRKPKLKPDLKLKCGACGEVGHMRTNKACPLYTGCDRIPSTPSNTNSVTEEPEEDFERDMYEDEDEEDLVNVEGTKVKLNSKLLKRHEDMKRQKDMLKYPRDQYGRRKRRSGIDNHCDYLEKHNKPANRRRTDPVVVMSTILEAILNEMRDMPDVQPFMFPVNAKNVPDYYKIIQRPMDLQTIRENLRQKRYQSREEFLSDVNQIVENSTKYNGPKSLLTEVSQRMLQRCIECFSEKEDRLMRLEKAINPLLDDNDQVALSFIFEKLISGKLKTMPESWPFLKPVNKKQVKDYYTVIRKPMDLETVTKKVSAHKYHSRQEFLADIELIAKNCEQYNGAESNFTAQAKVLFEVSTKSLMEEFSDHCSHLEKNIAIAQERARNDDDESWAEDDGDDSRMSSGDDMDMDTSTERNDPSFMVSPQPEVKRGPGRPRKIKEPQPDLPTPRKRGRPRKHPRPDNSQHLEEDLQFSSDEDEFEDVSDQEHDETTNLLTQGERTQFKTEDYGTMEDNQGEEDPQIASAAEAMVQLSGFYGQQQMQEESMDVDVDPNYDPSDFLGNLKQEPRETKPALDLSQNEPSNTSADVDNGSNIDVKPAAAIHDDLAISDSDEEPENLMILPKQEQNSFEEEPQANQSAEQQNTSTENKTNPDDDDLLWF